MKISRRTWLRFMRKVRITEDGHWLWQACKTKKGYGKFYWNGQLRYAHRFAYVVLRGEIPPELQTDHLCRIRNCVNPDCLEAVTARENTMRGFSVSALNAQKTHCKNGHVFDEVNTYIYVANNKWTNNHDNVYRQCRACQAVYDKYRRGKHNE